MSTARRLLAHLLVLTGPLLIAPAVMAQADIELISQGREVTLERHLVPGKLVVFDFYADWCAPCRVVTPRLERLAAQHPDRLALRKIDVIDWESPVARQHRVGSLPYLVLFGEDGRQLAAGDVNRVFAVLTTQLGTGASERQGVGSGAAVPPAAWITLVAAVVVGSFLLRAAVRRSERHSSTRASPSEVAAGDVGPKIWFALLDGGLDGPYSAAQLGRLRSTGKLDGATRIRRRGESTWRRLDDIVESS
jgi:thiol-disulfide isomerase/thioredoxin